MTTSFVDHFAVNSGKKIKQVNLLPSFIEPSDMSEIKHIVEELEVKYVMLPDTSDVVNGPMDGKFRMYPKGGTTLESIKTWAILLLRSLSDGQAPWRPQSCLIQNARCRAIFLTCL